MKNFNGIDEIVKNVVKNFVYVHNPKLVDNSYQEQLLNVLVPKLSLVEFSGENRRKEIWNYFLQLRIDGCFGVKEDGEFIENSSSIDDVKSSILNRIEDGEVIQYSELEEKYDSRILFLLLSSDFDYLKMQYGWDGFDESTLYYSQDIKSFEEYKEMKKYSIYFLVKGVANKTTGYTIQKA